MQEVEDVLNSGGRYEFDFAKMNFLKYKQLNHIRVFFKTIVYVEHFNFAFSCFIFIMCLSCLRCHKLKLCNLWI